MLSVIGIHSSCVARASAAAGAPPITAGHAWLTMHYDNGRMNSIGLWAVGELFQWRHLIRDPVGITDATAEMFEVRFDEELRRHYVARESRYYGLCRGQQSKAIMALGQLTGWRVTHTCATWATEKIQEIFGVSLPSSEFFGLTNTPRELGECLRRMERRAPTSVDKPYEGGPARLDGFLPRRSYYA